MTHPSLKLDDVVHQRVRLGILALLAEVARSDFSYVREALDLTDGNLSRHIQVLEEAGLVQVAKELEGRRPRTRVELTKAGAQALRAEMRSLRELIERIDGDASRPR